MRIFRAIWGCIFLVTAVPSSWAYDAKYCAGAAADLPPPFNQLRVTEDGKPDMAALAALNVGLENTVNMNANPIVLTATQNNRRSVLTIHYENGQLINWEDELSVRIGNGPYLKISSARQDFITKGDACVPYQLHTTSGTNGKTTAEMDLDSCRRLYTYFQNHSETHQVEQASIKYYDHYQYSGDIKPGDTGPSNSNDSLIGIPDNSQFMKDGLDLCRELKPQYPDLFQRSKKPAGLNFPVGPQGCVMNLYSAYNLCRVLSPTEAIFTDPKIWPVNQPNQTPKTTPKTQGNL